MLGDALSYPRNSDDSLVTLLIGGLATLLSVFVPLLPALALGGYTVRVLRSATTGGTAPPKFDEWGDLLVDGVKLLAIQLAYAVPLTVVTVLVAVSAVALTGVESGPAAPGDVSVSPVFLLVIAVVVLLALVVGYVLPAALANFAYYDRLGKAFALREVLTLSFTSDYFVAWVLVVVVGVVLGLVGAALSLVLVGFVVLFYVQVVAYYLFGRGYAAARRTRGLARSADTEPLG